MTIQIYPNQAFQVKLLPVLAPLQLQTLTQFYQPVMGSMAVSLFLTLANLTPETLGWSYRQPHSHLMTFMNCGIADINQARRYLEAMGLIKTYRDEASHSSYQRQTLVYELKTPLSVNQFINHPQFNISLFHQLGDESYYNLLDAWNEESLNEQQFDLTDISQPFTEVFNVYSQTTHEKEIINKVAGQHYQAQYEEIDLSQLDYSAFDFELFKQVLFTEGIDLTSITNVVKQEVVGLSQFYKLDEVMIARVVKLAFNEKSQQVNLPDLRTIARKQEYFANRPSPAQLQKAQKAQTELESPAAIKERKLETQKAYPHFTEAELEIIDICERLEPSKMLADLKRHIGGFASDSEQQTITRLQQQSSLNDSVINMLIYYIIKMRNNTNINKKFADLIANDWQQEGLTSPAQVMNYVMQQRELKRKQQAVREKQAQLNKSNQSYKYRQRNKRQENIPSWMQAEAQQEQNQPQGEQLSAGDNKKSNETQNHQAAESELNHLKENDRVEESQERAPNQGNKTSETTSADLAANEARLRERLKQLLEDKDVNDHA